jgi:hypothetical protein
MISLIQGSTGYEGYLSNSSTRIDVEGQSSQNQVAKIQNSGATSGLSGEISSQSVSLPGDTVTISTLAQEKLSNEGQTVSESGSTDGQSSSAASANVVPAGGKTPHYVKSVKLSDGQEVLQLGNTDASKSYFHKQGQNDLGYQGTCGLVSCGDVANQFGVKVNENDVVHYAVDHGLANVVKGSPAESGGTTMAEQATVLDGLGVSAHIEIGDSLEGLGRQLEEGHGVIIEVNAGALWNNSAYYDTGAPNHAVTVTGVASDPDTGKAVGIWVNDSGAGQYERYVSADDSAIQNWKANGEPSVVTDLEHA